MTAVVAIAVLHTLQGEHYGPLGALTSLVAFFGVALILVGELGLGTSALLAGLLLATLVVPVLGNPSWESAALVGRGSAHSGKFPLRVVSCCRVDNLGAAAGRSSLGAGGLCHLPSGSTSARASIASAIRALRGREP